MAAKKVPVRFGSWSCKDVVLAEAQTGRERGDWRGAVISPSLAAFSAWPRS
jgi:hypothetical protein